MSAYNGESDNVGEAVGLREFINLLGGVAVPSPTMAPTQQPTPVVLWVVDCRMRFGSPLRVRRIFQISHECRGAVRVTFVMSPMQR